MEKKKTYNMMLTCLSNIQGKVIENLVDKDENGKIKDEAIAKSEYTYYEVNNGKRVEVARGVMTNEAAIKYVMHDLNKKGDYLDSVYYVATEMVSKEAVSINRETKKEYHLGMTHIEFFEEQIYKYCDDYNLEPVNFIRPDGLISNAPNGEELINLSTTIANKILKVKEENSDKEFHLYIEANGGFRDFVNIATAVLSTLRNEDIHIEKVIGVNVSRNEGVYVDKTDAYQIYDLYSGIDEFINYGRSKKIDEFFTESNIKLSKPMKKVLDTINGVSQSFVMCRPKMMLDTMKKLKKTIEEYENGKENDKSEVFSFLTKKINNEYGAIFKSLDYGTINYQTLKQIINYCLNNNLIQQTLTLYSELMPDIFYENKIIYPGKLTKSNFDAYYADMEENLNKYPTKGYCFIQNYLKLNDVSFRRRNNTYEREKGVYGQYKERNKDDYNKNKDKPKVLLNTLFEQKYLYTKFDKNISKNLFINYGVIKQARNFSNHADATDDAIKALDSIDKVKEYVRHELSILDGLLGE